MSKKQLSSAQKNLLIEFVGERPELLSQKHTNQFTNVNSRKLWQELANKLNSIPGATKEWKEWRKTWSDMKTRTKKRKADNRKEANKTGGGPNLAEPVDALDDKILDIIGGEILIDGIQVPEVGLVLPDYEHLEKAAENVGDLDENHTYAKDVVTSPREDENEENQENIAPKARSLKRVRPPIHATRRQTSAQASVRATNELVDAQLQLVQAAQFKQN